LRESGRRERVKQVLLAAGVVGEPEGIASADTVLGEDEDVEEGELTAEDEQLQAKLAGALTAAVVGQLNPTLSVDGGVEEGSVGGEGWGLPQEEEAAGFGALGQENEEVLVKFAEDTDAPSAGGQPGLVSPSARATSAGGAGAWICCASGAAWSWGSGSGCWCAEHAQAAPEPGNRVSVKGQAWLEGGELARSGAGEGGEMEEAEVDALLEGYGWRGTRSWSGTPAGALLYPEEEKKIIRILEKGQVRVCYAYVLSCSRSLQCPPAGTR